MKVQLCPKAAAELAALDQRERIAMLAAIEKLQVLGDRLPAPHSSAVMGVTGTLRELRPRAGRSRWRAFYRRTGDAMVIGAIGPQATVNRAGFNRAVGAASDRLAGIERRGHTTE